MENYYSFILLGVMLVMMYFMVIRPQRTREKQQTEMRNSIEVGDGVTTIGGIVGRVVSVKDDTILVETGSDRVKIRLMKWAVQEVEKLDLSSNNDKPAK
ncbi:MAG: preprotein translocase subunit YajC [Oscillospiraceae bacterium]|nr:preprotein translocase subunit YajC [Oscillospiraceae bacterium]